MMEIPDSIYRELYDYLHDQLEERGYDADHDGEVKMNFDFISDDGRFSCAGMVSGFYDYVDDSFTHEFGIEHRHHYELDTFDLDEIDDGKMYFYDDTNDYECELDFDYDKFYHCEDEYVIRRRGVEINVNDDIIFRNFLGKWVKGRFKSYNPLEQKYFIESDDDRYTHYAYKLIPYDERYVGCIGTYKNII